MNCLRISKLPGVLMLHYTQRTVNAYWQAFAENTSPTKDFAGALAKNSAHGGIIGKDRQVSFVRRVSPDK